MQCFTESLIGIHLDFGCGLDANHALARLGNEGVRLDTVERVVPAELVEDCLQADAHWDWLAGCAHVCLARMACTLDACVPRRASRRRQGGPS